MRSLVLTLQALMLISCNAGNSDNSQLLGNDYRLFKNTPVWELAQAVSNEDIKEVKRIVREEKANIDYQESQYGKTLLMLCVINEDYQSCKTLLELGANPHLHDHYDGSSAIIDAAGMTGDFSNDPKFLKLLLDYGADPNDVELGERRKGNTQRNTPLLEASAQSLEKVKILIDAGANINYMNEFGTTALSRSFMQDKYDIVLYLLEQRADYTVAIINRDGKDYYLQDMLREVMLPLDSDTYEQKMKIVDFLKTKGLYYREVPIPDYIIERAKQSYPNDWEEYLKQY